MRRGSVVRALRVPSGRMYLPAFSRSLMKSAPGAPLRHGRGYPG